MEQARTTESDAGLLYCRMSETSSLGEQQIRTTYVLAPQQQTKAIKPKINVQSATYGTARSS